MSRRCYRGVLTVCAVLLVGPRPRVAAQDEQPTFKSEVKVVERAGDRAQQEGRVCARSGER